MRLTEERKTEILGWVMGKDLQMIPTTTEDRMILELLDEIDALRDNLRSCRNKNEDMDHAYGLLQRENQELKTTLEIALKTWRHMINSGLSFEGEYREEFQRLWKVMEEK